MDYHPLRSRRNPGRNRNVYARIPNRSRTVTDDGTDRERRRHSPAGSVDNPLADHASQFLIAAATAILSGTTPWSCKRNGSLHRSGYRLAHAAHDRSHADHNGMLRSIEAGHVTNLRIRFGWRMFSRWILDDSSTSPMGITRCQDLVKQPRLNILHKYKTERNDDFSRLRLSAWSSALILDSNFRTFGVTPQ